MKKMLACVLGLTFLNACMLKQEHDVSLANYKKRADLADKTQQHNLELEQNISRLEQDLADLTLRNQDLSTLNQQLVEKNQQLTQAKLWQNNQSLEHLKKTQLSKQIYLSIYDQLNASLKSSAQLLLKDDYLGIVLGHAQLFKKNKPIISNQGKQLIATILQALPEPHQFSIAVELHEPQADIDSSLVKTYNSQMSLRAFETGLIADAFKIKHTVKQINAKASIDTHTQDNAKTGNASFTVKLTHLP